jgi:general L-amino acid transport system substrate-binding protein
VLRRVGYSSYARTALLLILCLTFIPAKAQTLTKIQKQKNLHCGTITEEPEYSTNDDHGNRGAFDKDLCQSVAVAVLGPNAKTTLTEYPDDQSAMQALTSGAIDLIPTLTDDFTHTANTHLRLSRPILYDGVTFLLPPNSPVTNPRQLSGKKICFLAETTTEESTRAWFTHQHLNFLAFPFTEEGEMEAAFSTNNCAALAGDQTHLAQTQSLFAEHGRHSRLLLQLISNDPLAAAVRDNDPQWANIVNWVLESLIEAEERGLTQSNIKSAAANLKPDNPDASLRFFLGGSQEIGTKLGLANNWVVNAITATGNYGEIFTRDLGSNSPLYLPRGQNNLTTQGGQMQSLPQK